VISFLGPLLLLAVALSLFASLPPRDDRDEDRPRLDPWVFDTDFWR
jgi:hypothetical protein